ncbi:MAG: glycosyltransferase family 2 protein [Bacteroidales bacterium]|nr:glycosyltransferase family 2 protein [Bacteroidales bacterium]
MIQKDTEVSVIIPLFNEEVGIKQLLEKMTGLNYHEKYEILVIDDGSTDRSLEVIRQFPVRVLSHPVNKGYGAALKTGIRRAKGKKIIILDSDGQHDPVHIPEIAELLDQYEMVIGTRDRESHQVRTRQAGKRVIRWVGEYLVEQKLPDYNSGYRGFDTELIKRMLHMMPNGFSFSTTSTLAFLKEGYSIGTFPIMVEERVGRKSNVKFFKDGAKTLMLIMRIIMLFNPLKIFLPASVIFTLSGVIFGIYGYIVTERFSNGAIVLTILGMFLYFIGLVADQISILNRKS